MKGSAELIRQACAGRRPVRTPIFDVLQNDAVIAHFSGRPLDGSDDEETMIRAAANGLDGTRHVVPPWQPGEEYVDEAGNLHTCLRWTHWLKSRAFTAPEEALPWVRAQTEKLEARSSPTSAERAAERDRQASLVARLGDTQFIHCTPGSAFNTALFLYRLELDILPYLWVDEPGLTRRFLRAIMADAIRYVELMAHRSTSSLAMIYSDVAYHEKLMFSPGQMREMGFFEDIEGICGACHRAGLQVIFHSDGYIRADSRRSGCLRHRWHQPSGEGGRHGHLRGPSQLPGPDPGGRRGCVEAHALRYPAGGPNGDSKDHR